METGGVWAMWGCGDISPWAAGEGVVWWVDPGGGRYPGWCGGGDWSLIGGLCWPGEVGVSCPPIPIGEPPSPLGGGDPPGRGWPSPPRAEL